MEFSKSFLDWMSLFSDKISSGEKLENWDRGEREDFINIVLDKMARQCGGSIYFYKPEEKLIVVDGWIEALENFTAKQIINSVYRILNGEYSKGEHRTPSVPRTAFEFKCFVREERYREEQEKTKEKNMVRIELTEEEIKKREELGKKMKLFISKYRASKGTQPYMGAYAK